MVERRQNNQSIRSQKRREHINSRQILYKSVYFTIAMRDFVNSRGFEKYKNFVRSYTTYRQMTQMIHSRAVLRDFLILEMSNLRVEPIRFNSTTFLGRLDLLDHVVAYTDNSPDVLAYRRRMRAENPAQWP